MILLRWQMVFHELKDVEKLYNDGRCVCKVLGAVRQRSSERYKEANFLHSRAVPKQQNRNNNE